MNLYCNFFPSFLLSIFIFSLEPILDLTFFLLLRPYQVLRRERVKAPPYHADSNPVSTSPSPHAPQGPSTQESSPFPPPEKWVLGVEWRWEVWKIRILDSELQTCVHGQALGNFYYSSPEFLEFQNLSLSLISSA